MEFCGSGIKELIRRVCVGVFAILNKNPTFVAFQDFNET